MPSDSTADRPALPRVAVLVLNWNAAPETIECLESVLRLDYAHFSVVVCDNGSSDNSVDEIRQWAMGRSSPPIDRSPELAHLSDPPVPKPVSLVEYDRAEAERGGDARASDARIVLLHTGANLGFAGGVNVGLRYLLARNDVEYVWSLNNDIVVASDALSQLTACAAHGTNVGAVGGTLLEYDDPEHTGLVGGGILVPWKGVPAPARGVVKRLEYVSGGVMLVSLAVLRQVGLYDESYFLYLEDADLSSRMRRAGLRLFQCPQSRAWHRGGSTIGYRSPRHDYYTLRNSLVYARRHHPWLLPVALGYSLYRSVMPKIVRGQWRRLGIVAKAYRDFFTGVTGQVSLPRV